MNIIETTDKTATSLKAVTLIKKDLKVGFKR